MYYLNRKEYGSMLFIVVGITYEKIERQYNEYYEWTDRYYEETGEYYDWTDDWTDEYYEWKDE